MGATGDCNNFDYERHLFNGMAGEAGQFSARKRNGYSKDVRSSEAND